MIAHTHALLWKCFFWVKSLPLPASVGVQELFRILANRRPCVCVPAKQNGGTRTAHADSGRPAKIIYRQFVRLPFTFSSFYARFGNHLTGASTTMWETVSHTATRRIFSSTYLFSCVCACALHNVRLSQVNSCGGPEFHFSVSTETQISILFNLRAKKIRRRKTKHTHTQKKQTIWHTEWNLRWSLQQLPTFYSIWHYFYSPVQSHVDTYAISAISSTMSRIEWTTERWTTHISTVCARSHTKYFCT